MIHVRHATLDDAALLSEIGRETFFDSFAAGNTPENIASYLASAFGVEIQTAELTDVPCLYLIAEIDGETVGYARLNEGGNQQVSGTRPMEIVRIYARKQWIGQGVGAALMQTCLEAATQWGCDILWLGVWERNPRAIAFYQKWGFVRVGTHIFQMGNDPQTDWVMQRRVDDPAALVKRFNDALNARDVKAMMSLMTEDCVFENTSPSPDGARYEGQEAVRVFWETFFQSSTRAAMGIEEIFGGADRCVMRWNYHWTDLQGQTGHIRGVDVYTVRNGLITEKLSYVKG